MTTGPGKYDDLCTIVRDQAQAAAAIVIIVGGNKGGGFSVQTDDPHILRMLPDLLETMAAEIRKDAGNAPPAQ